MSSSVNIYNQLRQLAKSQGRTFQDILVMYGIERSLYRLSCSPFNKSFVLKGGVLLYLLFNGTYERSTKDIDLLQSEPSIGVDLKEVFAKVLSEPSVDDGLTYNLESIKVETKELFAGKRTSRISLVANLSKATLHLSFDISFNDVVIPDVQVTKVRELLYGNTFQLQTYSIESLIAEKLHAIVTFGIANTRVKDYYDIYQIYHSKMIRVIHLSKAIHMTFSNRKTKKVPAKELDKMIHSKELYQLWDAFLTSKGLDRTLNFSQVAETVLGLIPSTWID